jgi:hypothetical protein
MHNAHKNIQASWWNTLHGRWWFGSIQVAATDIAAMLGQSIVEGLPNIGGAFFNGPTRHSLIGGVIENKKDRKCGLFLNRQRL